MTHGRPWVQGCPWEVSKEPNDTRHIGYHFHSIFCTENEYKVAQPLGVHIRCPRGVPCASRVLWGSMKNLMIQGILGINFTALFTTKGYIRMDADYSFVLNSSETLASTFFGHITLFLGSVYIYS